MKLPWTVKKKINTPADQKLEIISNLLFPPLKLDQRLDSDGTPMKFHIDYSVDSNLDAVLMDLQEGNNDEVAHKTINTCIKKLNQVRRILEAYAELDKDAKYIIVDDSEVDEHEITAREH